MSQAIAFTLCQRPFYTASTLDTWLNVRGLDKYDVSFHIEPTTQTLAQVSKVENFGWRLPTTRVEWEVNDVVLGVSLNPLKALRHAFADPSVEYAVLAEEDVEVGNDVLEYIEFALEHAEIACAWSDEDGPIDEVVLRKWFNPWIWGIHREAFELVIEPTWDTDFLTGDGRGPGGWDCHIGLRLVHEYDLKVAFPRASRSRHAGKWLGVNQVPEQYGRLEDPVSFGFARPPQEWTLTGDRDGSPAGNSGDAFMPGMRKSDRA